VGSRRSHVILRIAESTPCDRHLRVLWRNYSLVRFGRGAVDHTTRCRHLVGRVQHWCGFSAVVTTSTDLFGTGKPISEIHMVDDCCICHAVPPCAGFAFVPPAFTDLWLCSTAICQSGHRIYRAFGVGRMQTVLSWKLISRLQRGVATSQPQHQGPPSGDDG